MSDQEFQKRIAELLRRLATMRAVERGELTVKRVAVKGHYVPRYWVQPHKRNIVVRPKRAVTTVKRAA